MEKLCRVSDYLNISHDVFEENGVYDGYLNVDSELYINPKLLKNTTVVELKNSYNKVISHYMTIIDLLKKSRTASSDDLMWQCALKMFSFPEPNGVALGTSELSINGKGLSGETAENALKKIKEMVDNGIDDPQIFGLLAVVQKNIGVDRVSDMISNIIYDDLLKYSENMFKKINISELDEIEYHSEKYYIKKRPNGSNLILIPKQILSNIPPFIDYYSIQEIINENISIKQEIYLMFYEANKKLKNKTISQVNIQDLEKEQVFEIIKKFNLYSKVLSNNSLVAVKPYDFEMDKDGIHKPIDKISKIYADREKDIMSEILKIRNSDFSGLVEDLINHYKYIIESKGLNQDLYHEIKTKSGKKYYRNKNEGFSHRLFIATIDGIKKIKNFDYTFEPKSSNGEVDFRFSRGDEIILVEFKLNTNKLKNGYNNQLVEYMKREKSTQGYYVIIKVADNNSIDNFIKNTKIVNERKVIIIDGLIKKSPSHI